MGVFLIILKIIGIILVVLLSVIGVLLLLILLALVLPIGYQVFVDKSDKLSYSFSIKYFLFSVIMGHNKETQIKIFGKQLIPRKKKITTKPPAKPMPLNDELVEEKDNVTDFSLSEIPEVYQKPEAKQKSESKKQKKESKKTASRFGIDFLREYILKKNVLKAVCKLIIRILKAVLPKEHRIRLIIGFDDPSLTGQILGICGIVTGALNPAPNIVTIGDFEKQRLECEVKVAGRFSLISIVFALLRFALTRDIWKIIKFYLKREDDGHGDSRQNA